jgi:hypothetical protein
MTENVTGQEDDRMTEQKNAIKPSVLFKFALAGAVILVPCAAYLISWHPAKDAASTKETLSRNEETPLSGGKPHVGNVAHEAQTESRQAIKKELERQTKEVEQHIQLLNELNSKLYVFDEGIDGVPAGSPVSAMIAPPPVLPERNQQQVAPHQESYLPEEKTGDAAAQTSSDNRPNQVVIQQLVELPSLQQNLPPDGLHQQASPGPGEMTGADAEPPSSARQMQLPPQEEWRQERTVTAAKPTVRLEAAAPVLPQQNPPPNMVDNRISADGAGYKNTGTVRIVRVPPSAAVTNRPNQSAALSSGQAEQSAAEDVVEELETDDQAVIRIPASAGDF